jgi:hypothetical protein
LPLIAPLVDTPLPEERAAKLAAEELRRRQLAALTAWLLTGARSQPVVLAFEDLHWADPTSLDLIQALSEGGRPAPLFKHLKSGVVTKCVGCSHDLGHSAEEFYLALSEARNGKLNPWWDMVRRMAHQSPSPDVTQVGQTSAQPDSDLVCKASA